LSGLSACAGVVVAPKIERRLRQLAFVPLGPGQALAVLVGEDGSVENRVIDLPPGMSAPALAEVGHYVSARLTGLTLAEAEQRLRTEMEERRQALDLAAAELVATGLAEWREDGPARPVLIESARDGEGCRIFIGSENRMFALSGSSVIAAPYRGAEGRVVGVVGVIGPTRLNYGRIVPMVDYTAQALTRLMG
jgi:heat-inducible transcriptional repressor